MPKTHLVSMQFLLLKNLIPVNYEYLSVLD